MDTPTNDDKQPGQMVSNTTKATAVGATSGGAGTLLATWLGIEGERRFGVPAVVTAGVLGTGFAFIARWAAKLLPDD